MKAYVEIVQRKEREIGCDVLTHQKVRPSRLQTGRWPLLTLMQWSGGDYADSLLKTVTGGVSSTAAMGKGVTEDQFKARL